MSCKRDNLFSEENRDLALVAKTWPELLPEVCGPRHQSWQQRASWGTVVHVETELAVRGGLMLRAPRNEQ